MENSYLAKLEALLFASGIGIRLETLMSILDLEQELALDLLSELEEKLDQDQDSGLMVAQVDDLFLLTIKQDLRTQVSELYNTGSLAKLTPASYEVLAAILYNQPVTRAQVEAIRGVNSDGIISRLEERKLVEECGILDQPGRPSVFRVTDKFMLEMGISSAKDLAPVELLMYENIRKLEEGEE